MKYFLRTLLSAVLWAIVAILLLFVGSGLFQRIFNRGGYTGLFGIGYAVVVSGSMKPVFNENDMIIYQTHDRADYQPGDIVVYVRDQGTDNEILITHRLIGISEDQLITKGDANSISDKPIGWDQLIGRVVFLIPGIGKAVEFLRTPLGILVSVVLIVALSVINLLPVLRSHTKKKAETVNGGTIRY